MNNCQNLAYWNSIGTQKIFNNPNLILENDHLVTKNSSILDIGCGYGRTLSELRDKDYNNIFGIDYSSEMIKLAIARNKLPEERLFVGSSLNLPFSENQFDAALLFALLNCLPNDADDIQAIQEAKRVVRPGGYIMVNDFIASEASLQGDGLKSDKFGNYAILKIDNSCLMRHTTIERAKNMNFGMELMSFKISSQLSMNGNPTTILSYIFKV